MPREAKTASTASSVPGSLRTANTRVVRRAWPGDADGRGVAAPGFATTRNRVRLSAPTGSVGQDRAEQRGRPRREQGRRPSLPPVGDELARAGRVVGRQQAPRPGAQERLGLAERLDVGVDALDVLEILARQRRQAEPDRHDHLANDDQVVLE
jgi:hypothetical protein